MFEHKSEPLLSPSAFFHRMLFWSGLSLSLIVASLAVGVCGYHYTEHMAWLDALLNASMILGGMGEIDPLHTIAGKFFASFYSIYCGFFLVLCGGLLFAPVFHRILHHFHAVDADNE